MSYKDWTKIVHQEGYIFIVIFVVVTFLLSTTSSVLGIIAGILTIGCVFFFRNPDRVVPLDPNNVVAPADGVIQSIKEVVPPEDLGLGKLPLLRISIFLNIFDVHVNRIPVQGQVINLNYHAGKFVNASLDKASIYNERQSLVIETAKKIKVGVVQIAGLVARRIVCNVEENQEVQIGDRFGIIRFGSRVDVYLPKKTIPIVAERQRAVGGETILAKLKSDRVAPPQCEIK